MKEVVQATQALGEAGGACQDQEREGEFEETLEASWDERSPDLSSQGGAKDLLSGGQSLVDLPHSIRESVECGSGQWFENALGAFEMEFRGMRGAVHRDCQSPRRKLLSVMKEECFPLLIRQAAQCSDERDVRRVIATWRDERIAFRWRLAW